MEEEERLVIRHDLLDCPYQIIIPGAGYALYYDYGAAQRAWKRLCEQKEDQ